MRSAAPPRPPRTDPIATTMRTSSSRVRSRNSRSAPVTFFHTIAAAGRPLTASGTKVRGAAPLSCVGDIGAAAAQRLDAARDLVGVLHRRLLERERRAHHPHVVRRRRPAARRGDASANCGDARREQRALERRTGATAPLPGCRGAAPAPARRLRPRRRRATRRHPRQRRPQPEPQADEQRGDDGKGDQAALDPGHALLRADCRAPSRPRRCGAAA